MSVASIVVAPFTGGMSLAYVATKVTSKVTVKKGTKYLVRKVVKRALNRGIYKARKVRKVIDNTIGIRSRNNIGKFLDKSSNIIGDSNNALVIGGSLLYLNDIEPKTICKE